MAEACIFSQIFSKVLFNVHKTTTTTTTTTTTIIYKKTHNWRAPGPDQLQNFWYKKFTAVHGTIAILMIF
jgi:hypothetical protein